MMLSRSSSTQGYSEDKHLLFNTRKFYFQQKLGGLKLDPKATILEMWGWVLGGANNGCLGPAVPTARTSAKPGQTGGRVWHGRGAMVTEQISTEKGYKNEAIVWPKWSTPGKEWHIHNSHTGLLLWPASRVLHIHSLSRSRIRCIWTLSKNTKIWHQQEQQETI